MKGISWNALNIFSKRKRKHQIQQSTTNDINKEHLIPSILAKQCFLAFAPLLLNVGNGTIYGYSAILLPQLESNESNTITIDTEEASWIASLAALPMAFGSLLGGVLSDRFGRRATHTITSIPTLIGWLLIFFATNTKLILYGRFITGFCSGMLGPVTGVYIGETSDPKYRGFLLAGISCAVSLGLFMSHLLGTYLHWQTTALVCSTLPFISLIILFFLPESPSWLATKGKIDKAEKSFYWCRGSTDDSKKELGIMLERQASQDKESNKNYKERLKELLEPQFWKPLGIIVVYIVANQWAGVNALTFYAVDIMKRTIGQGFNEYFAMLLVDIIRVFMSILVCILLRKMGRRPLAIVSGIGTFSSLFILSLYTFLTIHYPKISNESYIPMAALVMYISFITIGFVPLPWALMGELFSLKDRSVGGGISSFMAFTAFFSVVKTSPSMLINMGASGTFLLYGVVALVGTVFVYICLPETKDKPLYEIEDSFKRKSNSVNNNIKSTIKSIDNDNNNV